jgi:hypothetical protein
MTKKSASDHKHNGNCWHGLKGKTQEHDVCTDHDEPRGECSVCSACPQCVAEGTTEEKG